HVQSMDMIMEDHSRMVKKNLYKSMTCQYLSIVLLLEYCITFAQYLPHRCITQCCALGPKV
ncbi:hypothetical protein, partial [Daeguia caeni]|uniref:hypothetical protein n=1 Tax=Daeguia caeni TaxID=439612 RepID=UPI0035BC3730